jgi:hypothetical protein
VIQCFLLGQSAFALNTDDKYQKQKRLMNQEQTRTKHVQEDQETVTTGYSELVTQGHSKPSSSNNNQSELNAVVEALGDQPADLKAGTLKAMGCSMSKAASVLMKNGATAEQTSKALVNAGYDKKQVDNYLSGTIQASSTPKTDTQQIAKDKYNELKKGYAYLGKAKEKAEKEIAKAELTHDMDVYAAKKQYQSTVQGGVKGITAYMMSAKDLASDMFKQAKAEYKLTGDAEKFQSAVLEAQAVLQEAHTKGYSKLVQINTVAQNYYKEQEQEADATLNDTKNSIANTLKLMVTNLQGMQTNAAEAMKNHQNNIQDPKDNNEVKAKQNNTVVEVLDSVLQDKPIVSNVDIKTHSITNDLVKAQAQSQENQTSQPTYASMAGQGMPDNEIVNVLKEQGATSTDILKAATQAGSDMNEVANAMKEAGYSNKEIAQAYISKAMDWTAETTVDVVNCAAQSLAEMLSGQGNIVSTVELAYEVIASDIMQSGKVNIQDGQIMSSMSAIKDVAAEHGIELEGVNATITDLKNISGSSIAHLDNNHWVTVTEVKADAVTVIDNGKEVTMTKAEFASRWDGNLLTQDKSKGKILDAQQMLKIFGADIGDADGNSHGAGNEGGHDGSGDMGGGGHSGGDGGSENNGGGWGQSLSDWGKDRGGVLGGLAQLGGGLMSGIGKGVDAVSGGLGKACGAVSDFGKTVNGWGQSLSDWGKDRGGVLGGLAQLGGGLLGAAGTGISGLGNLGKSAVDGFNNMSTAGKLATVVGACFGVPCVGAVVDMAVNTYDGMKTGASLKDSLSDAFDNSLAGKAVDAMLDNPVTDGLKDMANIGNQIQAQGKSMVEDGKKKGGITGALQQGLGYAVQGVGFVSDVAVHGVSVTGKALAGAATGLATAPVEVVSGVLDIGSGLVNQDMDKAKRGVKDLAVGSAKIGAAYVGAQIATSIATDIATEVAMTGSVPSSVIGAGASLLGITGLVDSQTDGKLGDVVSGNLDALGPSNPANVSIDDTFADTNTNGSENELLIRPLMPAF